MKPLKRWFSENLKILKKMVFFTLDLGTTLKPTRNVVQVGSTECKNFSKFKIVISFNTIFFLHYFQKMLKTYIRNWFSIKKVNLYVIPKFLLRLLPPSKYVSIFWLSASCDEIKSGCFSYIRQILHLLQIKIYQKFKMGICCA